jgi:hypothetical protein
MVASFTSLFKPEPDLSGGNRRYPAGYVPRFRTRVQHNPVARAGVAQEAETVHCRACRSDAVDPAEMPAAAAIQFGLADLHGTYVKPLSHHDHPPNRKVSL